MKATMSYVWILVIFLVTAAGFILLGCGDDHHVVSDDGNGGEKVAILRVTPADGASAIEVASPITVRFTGPVDTASVRSNLHLMGGSQMHDWQDSLEHYGGFGMMGMHQNQRMMQWVDSIHVPGEFHWNEQLDSCEFIPDDGLVHDTEYLCLLYEGGMHDNHGGMMGGASHGDNGYHMYEFMTEPE